MADTVTSLERELLDICQELGGIAESSGIYTHGLARRLAERGKPVGELTVAELLAQARSHREAFIRVHTAAAFPTQHIDKRNWEPEHHAR